METTKLKRFAQYARRTLREQVAAKMGMVLGSDSAARRENAKVVQDLEKQIRDTSKEHIIEKVAYTWFNRFCALRFMDVNRYSRIGVVSPLEGQFQPEILAEAKMGHIDEEMMPATIRQQVTTLLNGTAPSRDPQQEAYRLLVVAACNDFHRTMPYLFERIADYTELLMPDDLLSGNSILAYTREAMTPDICQDVEVIGWLYQFYISERKDEVFEGLKKNRKIDPENIPAATQLFTPHWIVRYLVENSLGRLWLLNNPNSRLAEQMDYYVNPEHPETDFLRIHKPEDIKVCDPACGSGHMLTYAFDLLYAIYEEVGTDPAEIPEKILIHNLFGIEIDERAGELAAFALTMKARAKHRRFFNKRVQPNICILQNVEFDKNELDEYMLTVGRDLFTVNLRETLTQFVEVNNFGSLIRPALTDVAGILSTLEAKDMTGQLFLAETHRKVLVALRQADYLSPRYYVVIANPPYMGSKGMNRRLDLWTKASYPDSKSDLYSMFIERGIALTVRNGAMGMITMQSWMFLSSFEELRRKVIEEFSIKSLIQIGYNSFPELNSKVAQACAFVIKNTKACSWGEYFNLNDAPQAADKNMVFLKQKSNLSYSKVDQRDFKAIPGLPIAYWIGERIRRVFAENDRLGDVSRPRQGLASGDNDRFMRYWHEVELNKIGLTCSAYEEAIASGKKWFPHNKGGEFRKWYGNIDLVLAFDQENFNALSQMGNHLPSRQLYFKEGMSWTALTSGKFNGRYTNHAIFDAKGPVLFANEPDHLPYLIAFCNSSVSTEMLKILAPTLDFNQGPVGNLPIKFPDDIRIKNDIDRLAKECITLATRDWNSRETSWGFLENELVCRNSSGILQSACDQHEADWREAFAKMQKNEESINSHFVNIFDLDGEICHAVSPDEITIQKAEISVSGKSPIFNRSEMIRQFVSYAVGCMFGRYSLEKQGLILAKQGETLDDYLDQVPEPSYMPDVDNVIPMVDGDWFSDDIAELFRSFVRVTFGDDHYEANIVFIEEALGKKGKPQSIRDYFLKDFYVDHVKRYKKRPIYWLFSSSKGTFNALVYLHRYRPDTVSVVLNDYLREFRTKLAARKSHLEQVSISSNASAVEKTKALKEIEDLKQNIVELESYERDVLYPLATEQKKIDLDRGVKYNYGLFGPALKKIVGLDASED